MDFVSNVSNENPFNGRRQRANLGLWVLARVDDVRRLTEDLTDASLVMESLGIHARILWNVAGNWMQSYDANGGWQRWNDDGSDDEDVVACDKMKLWK